MVLIMVWRDKIKNKVLYGNLPRLSTNIRMRRLCVAGHCLQHPELLVRNVISGWTVSHLYQSNLVGHWSRLHSRNKSLHGGSSSVAIVCGTRRLCLMMMMAMMMMCRKRSILPRWRGILPDLSPCLQEDRGYSTQVSNSKLWMPCLLWHGVIKAHAFYPVGYFCDTFYKLFQRDSSTDNKTC